MIKFIVWKLIRYLMLIVPPPDCDLHPRVVPVAVAAVPCLLLSQLLVLPHNLLHPVLEQRTSRVRIVQNNVTSYSKYQ